MPLGLRFVAAKLVNSFHRGGLGGILKRCAAELEEIWFDLQFGIDTRAIWKKYAIPDGYERDLYVSYGPTKIRTLKKIFSELRISYEDFIFVDVGSGKGRVLLVASEFPFKRIIGVEFSPELHSIAETNIRAYRSTTQKCSAIESKCCDATCYRMPPENTVLFLFNPFKSPIVSSLLTNLAQSLLSHPRQVYLVYVNQFCHDLILESGFLEVVRFTKLYALYKNKMPAPCIPVPELTAAIPRDNGDQYTQRYGLVPTGRSLNTFDETLHQRRGTASMMPQLELVADKLVSSFRRKGLIGTLKSCADEIEEIRFDRTFGIDTLETTGDRTYGLSAWKHPEYNIWYQPTKVGTLRKIFSDLHINHEDFIFVDFGSGKGRALLVASEFPFRRIIGVELLPELHSIAQKNIRTYRSATQKCRAIESNCSDATLYPVPPENMVLFFNNTFKSPVVSRLMTNLRESLQYAPRRLYIACISVKLQGEDTRNPVCHDVMANAGFLEVVRATELYAIYKDNIPYLRRLRGGNDHGIPETVHVEIRGRG